jgi:hypothetical protein
MLDRDKLRTEAAANLWDISICRTHQECKSKDYCNKESPERDVAYVCVNKRLNVREQH